jgi:hypothetical protein
MGGAPFFPETSTNHLPWILEDTWGNPGIILRNLPKDYPKKTTG